MRKELVFALGLTIATVGGACKREPQQQPPPTPIAASGVPKPGPTTEATAQKIPERELVSFVSADNGYQLLHPKGWVGHTRWEGTNTDMFFNPQAKNFATELNVDALFLRNVSEVNAQKWVERTIEESKKYLEQQKRKGEVKKNESLPFNADSGAILETRILEDSSEYETRFIIFKKGPWIYRFKLKADPSMIDQEVKTVEEMRKTLELTQIPQLAETPPRPAEAQKPTPSPVEKLTGIDFIKIRSTSFPFPYEIEYPAFWTRSKFGQIDVFLGETVNAFTTNANVIAEPTSLTLDKYTNHIRTLIEQSGMKVYSQKRVTTNNLEFGIIEGGGPANEFRSAILVDRGLGWQITLSAHSSVIHKNLPIFEKMYKSFQDKR